MATKTVPTELARLELMLLEIASLAKTISTHADHGLDRDTPDEEGSDAAMISMRYLSKHVGWLADLGLNEIGSLPTIGHEPLDWLMPAALRSPEAAPEAGHD